jgi:hypothetical protein
MSFKYLTILVATTVFACGPSVKINVKTPSQPLPAEAKVKILYLNREAPKNGQELGTIDFGDTGFSTSCNYAKFVEVSTQEAKRIGANTVKIMTHSGANLWTSCDEITAVFYKQ